jgi:uncharacterized protein YqgC (DUF456 family)
MFWFIANIALWGTTIRNVGMLLGPLLRVIIGEYIYHSDLGKAVKARIGIVVGNLVQGILAVSAVVIFIWTTWTQVYGG